MSFLRHESELSTIARHAGSVLVGQLAVMAFGVIDTVVAGRYSDTALAALSVGSAIYISVYVSLIGIVQALLPVYAELHGAGRPRELGQALRQTLYLCAAIAVLGVGLLLAPGPVLRWAEVPDSAQPEIRAYLGVLALAFVPSLLFRTYASLNQALGKPLLVTWIQIGALAVKLPLSIWFVAGGAGIAPMGAVGCAWATLVVAYLMFGLALVLLRTQTVYHPLALWRLPERPQWPRIGEFARLGLPSGIATMIEITSFTLMALFVARLGTVASASHQIAASVAAILYMFPLSVGIASSARASYWLGATQPRRAHEAVLRGFQLMVLCSLPLALALFLCSTFLARLYSNNPEIIAAAGVLLAWVALYHLADAVQCLCVFLLRCYRITVAPMVVYGVVLWCLGLYGGYLLTYQGLLGQAPWQSPTGFWAAAAIALIFVALVFVAMLVQATRRSR